MTDECLTQPFRWREIEDDVWDRWRKEPPVAAFEDLTVRRQINLLWAYTSFGPARFPDFEVMMGSGAHCRTLDYARDRPVEAVLGSDGRYHAVIGDTMACSYWSDAHEMWFTSQRRTRKWPYVDEEMGDGEQAYCARWDVALLDERKPPHLVPAEQRCTVYANWPPSIIGTKLTPAVKLLKAIGPYCGICGADGFIVDHDHFTGYARGLLCRQCNSAVDRCAHVAGCGNAEYLNDPPATGLGIKYPGHNKWLARPGTQARQGLLIQTIQTHDRLRNLRDFIVEDRLVPPQ